jgi:CBS domain containing-hemolysin-like protein
MSKIIDVDEGLFDEHKGNAETIAGLMLEHKRRFLRKGDTLSLCGVKFTVAEAQVRKVNKIKVEVENNESSDN